MRNTIIICAVASSLFILGGCSAIGTALNPFQSEFQCPKTANGKCISIKGAYNEDVAAAPEGEFNPEDTLPATNIGRSSFMTVHEADQFVPVAEKPCCGSKPDTKPEIAVRSAVQVQKEKLDLPIQEYRDASLKKITKMLRDPVTPIVAPPHVMRVLILPYEDDDGALNLQRFKYVMVDRPKWVLGDYLAKEEGSE